MNDTLRRILDYSKRAIMTGAMLGTLASPLLAQTSATKPRIQPMQVQIGTGEFFTVHEHNGIQEIAVPYDKDIYVVPQEQKIRTKDGFKTIRTEVLLRDCSLNLDCTKAPYLEDTLGNRLVIRGRINPEDYGIKDGARVLLENTYETPDELFQTARFYILQGTRPAPAEPRVVTQVQRIVEKVPTVMIVEKEKHIHDKTKSGISVGVSVDSNEVLDFDAMLLHKEGRKWSFDLGGWYGLKDNTTISERVQDDMRTIQGKQMQLTTDLLANYKVQEFGILAGLHYGKKATVGFEAGLGRQTVNATHSYEQLATVKTTGEVEKRYVCETGHEDLDKIIARLAGIIQIPLGDNLRIYGKGGVKLNNISFLNDPYQNKQLKIAEKNAPYAGVGIQVRF